MKLTDEERRNMRELIDLIYQFESHMKHNKKLTGKDLHGGFLGFLIPLLTTALRFGIPALARAIPTLIRTGIQVGSRLLPTVGRAIANVGSKVIQQVQSKALSGAVRSGLIRGTVRSGATGARTTGTATRGLAGESVKRGLVKKIGTALTLTGATGVLGDEGGDFVDDYVDPMDGNPYVEPAPPRVYTQEEDGGMLPAGEAAPEPDFDIPEDEGEAGYNLAPLKFAPRVRNVFTAAQSRNPLSTAYGTTTLLASKSVASRQRDLGALMRGSGIVHRKRVLKKYGLHDTGHSLVDLARITGVKKSVLQEVYNRGIGAYETNPRSVRMKVTFAKGVDAPKSKKLSKEQWAMARVYSFLDNNPKHDDDLRS